MSERQLHGLNFEKLILNNIFGNYKGKYIDKFDIPITESNKFGFNYNISIKSIGINNAVELGSLLRFYENTEPFIMIVGWHVDKNIKSINEYLFSEDILDKLKGTISLEKIKEIYNTLNLENFPLGKHEEARKYFKEIKKLLKNDLGLLTITGKVDSKTQRRWQCNINNTNFKKLFGNLIIQTKYKNINIA